MYGYETPKYLIPAQTVGDVIQGQEEQRQANIIDTQLFGLMRSNNRGHGVIATGKYLATFATNNSTVQFSEDKPKYAVEALINQTYVYSINPFSFTGLADNTLYYLYIRLVEDAVGQSSVERGEFVTYASIVATPPTDGILIATATTTTSTITVDANPLTLITIPIISDHVSDNTDPHGVLLYQTALIVNNSLVSSGNTQFNALQTELMSGTNAYFTNLLSGSGTVRINTAIVSGATNINGNVTVLGSMNFPSGINIAGNVSVSSGVSIDGRDIGADGALLDAHLINYSNPHQVTLSQLSGLNKYGDTLKGNLAVQSGKTIDGIDVGTLQFLFDGSNATGKHTHPSLIPASGIEQTQYCPEYPSAVFSGVDFAVQTIFDNTLNSNTYYVEGIKSGGGTSTGIIALRHGISTTTLSTPNDFLKMWNQRQTGTTNAVNIVALDTNNNNISLTGANLANNTWTQNTVVFSGNPTLAKNGIMTVFARATVDSGTWLKLGDASIRRWEDYTGV